MSDTGFTHLDEHGHAHMVDVTAKPTTVRQAVARGRITMSPSTAARLAAGELPGGDVLSAARAAGRLAAKATPTLVPLCHQVLLGDVTIDLTFEHDGVEIIVTADAQDRTGVEMEALTAVSIAALTIYQMCKSHDRQLVIDEVALWEKSGGRSGSWTRRPDGVVEHRALDRALEGDVQARKN